MRSPAPIHIDGYHHARNRKRRHDDSSSLMNVLAAVAMIAFLTASIAWLPACASDDGMSRNENAAIVALVKGAK